MDPGDKPVAVKLPRPEQLRVVEPSEKYRFPISILLVAGFGGLVALAVASVLYLGLVSAGRNTFELIDDAANYRLDTIETHIRDLLEPTRRIAGGMANAIEEGRVDPADKAQLYDVLRGIVTGAPQISGAFYSDRDHQLTIVNRRDDGGFEEMEADNSNDPNFARVLQLVAKGPGWGRITWQP